MKNYLLGIDTSAYTTSVAIIDIQGNIIYDCRKKLFVPEGQIGLRQQEALFQHINNLPDIFNEFTIDFNEVKTISVSNKPRNNNNSYMPVFIAGTNFGRTIAKVIGATFIEYSHQENHISSAFFKKKCTLHNNFLTIHISGGTAECLLTSKVHSGFETQIVGGSKDITFGQLIDRIGVYLGFKFPAGYDLEQTITDDKQQTLNMPKISGNEYINLSGIENFLKEKYDVKKISVEKISLSLFNYIGKCICHIIENLKNKYKFNDIIITGGVASNKYIRKFIENELANKFNLYICDLKYSTDNALGNAYLPLLDKKWRSIK